VRRDIRSPERYGKRRLLQGTNVGRSKAGKEKAIETRGVQKHNRLVFLR